MAIPPAEKENKFAVTKSDSSRLSVARTIFIAISFIEWVNSAVTTIL